jgi:preprotein translocase subunit SecE
MAKNPGVIQTAMRRRTPLRAAPGGTPPAAAASDAAPKKPFNPIQFFTEVRAEARKITWTSWKETWITSVMVGIMVILTAMFFFAVDGTLSFGIHQVLDRLSAR